VQVCNNVNDAAGARINFDYYVQEVEKLVNILR
jgi:ppGpp synthetase/RelA/SpoT-type nucleotidyltranferase